MTDGKASKTLDDLLAVLLEDDDSGEVRDPQAEAELNAMVKETAALIEQLHADRAVRRFAEAEATRRQRELARPVKDYGAPLPSKEQLVAELRAVMKAAGQEAAFHALKFQDAGPEDIAEMIASAKHLLEGNDE